MGKDPAGAGSHNVAESCFEAGFSSLGSFGALFARRVGPSPSGYRRHARAGIVVPREVRPLFVPACFAAMVYGPPPKAQDPRNEPRRPDANFASVQRLERSRDPTPEPPTVCVRARDEALAFYRDAQGFEVRVDMPTDEEGAVRGLTVSSKGQPDLESVLMPITAGSILDDASAEQTRSLVARAIQASSRPRRPRRLRAPQGRGGRVRLPAQARPYGTGAIFKDNSGNGFSLTQRR